MGTRIHKVMGYGITNRKVNDPRLNKDALDNLWQREDATFDAWVKWIFDNKALLVELALREYPGLARKDIEDHVWFAARLLQQMTEGDGKTDRREKRVEDCIVSNGMDDHPKVLVFYPPNCPDWARYDDTIDYHEANRSARNKVKRMVHGIYPYNSGLIRCRPPSEPFLMEFKGFTKRSDEHGPLAFNPGEYSQLVGIWDRKQKPLAKGAFLKHLKEDFRPPVPFAIIALIVWSGIAKDPAAFIDDLRPMIYTYWS